MIYIFHNIRVGIVQNINLEEEKRELMLLVDWNSSVMPLCG